MDWKRNEMDENGSRWVPDGSWRRHFFPGKLWTGKMQIELDTGPRRGEMVFRCIEQET